MKKITLHTLRQMKEKKEPIAWLTCYDYPMAQIMDKAGVDMLLVGDSAAMTVLGYKSTLLQSLDVQLALTEAVVRGSERAFVVGDMPYMTYESSHRDAILNGGKFMRVGCDAIKLEGGARVADTIKAMVKAGLPVMGHIGLTPQSAASLGGYRVQGKTDDAIDKLIVAPTEADGFSENYYNITDLEAATSVEYLVTKNLKGKTTPTGANNVYAVVYPL